MEKKGSQLQFINYSKKYKISDIIIKCVECETL